VPDIDGEPLQGSNLLDGKVAVVSGVGPGLGAHLARQLAAHGAAVVVAARRRDVLESVAEGIRADGGRAVAVPADMSDRESCRAVMAAAADAFGGIDVLVNNAFRLDVFQTFADVDLDRWRKVIDTNLFGTLQMTQAAVPHLRRRRGGSVVMVSSMSIHKPHPLEGAYTIAKGAILTATRVLALELAPDAIRVNALVPGWMWGPAVQTYVSMTAQGRGVDESAVVAEITARIPLGRIPTDAEVARSIVYLASDLSAPVTGQTLDVNGGEIFV
jgi:NAD(P)-dependent dehydrogenase (short-subunit alcohol dehydrogenase family)